MAKECNVTIDGIDIGSLDLSIHGGTTLTELYDAAVSQQQSDNLEKYLRDKYDGFNGVPYCNMVDETELSTEQINRWLKVELEITENQLRNMKNKLFVPIELVAEMIAYENKNITY